MEWWNEMNGVSEWNSKIFAVNSFAITSISKYEI